MIKNFETFDSIVVKNDTTDPLVSMGWELDSFSGQRSTKLIILPTSGRNGSSAIVFPPNAVFAPPTIPRGCNRLVLGLAIRSPLVANPFFATPLVLDPYTPPTGYPVVTPWSDHNDNYSLANRRYAHITVKFCYGTLVNFTATVEFRTTGVIISGKTGTGGYDGIADMPYISAPHLLWDYTFVELLVDVTDFLDGIFKAAINGVTVEEKTGIVTCDHLAFGSDPYDARAKLNRVEVTVVNRGYYGQHYFMLDTLYLCDDDGGYHNDFLGPAFSKPLYPKEDGDKANWTPYINSTVVEDAPRYAILDDAPFNPASESDYLQADQDLVEEMMKFDDADMPAGCTPIAVNHRTAARGVATPGTPPPNALIPLFQATGNPLVQTPSLMKRISGWDYQFLDIYYNIVPGLSIPWTDLLIGESQFGFMLHEPVWTAVQIDEAGFADEVLEDHIPEVTDEPMDFGDEALVEGDGEDG